MINPRFSGRTSALCFFAAIIGTMASNSIAQSYAGCFVNGQQVPDSVCRGGSGGGTSTPSLTSSPMFGNTMSMSRELGGAIVKSLMSPPGQPSPPVDSAHRVSSPTQDPGRAARQAADADARSLANHLTNEMRQREESQAALRQSLSDLAKETQSQTLRDAPNDPPSTSTGTVATAAAHNHQTASSPLPIQGPAIKQLLSKDCPSQPIPEGDNTFFYQCNKQDRAATPYCLEQKDGWIREIPCH